MSFKCKDYAQIDFVCLLFFRDLASYGVIIDGDGQVTDFIKLQFLMMRKNSWKERERELKVGLLIE